MEIKRMRLLTAVRDAAVDLANGADDQGDSVLVDAWAYNDVIRSINRLMEFEDEHPPVA
jgi:hypothetical protein